jgi:hypothetical protein
MSAGFAHSWATIEAGCFDYLGRALGTIEDVQGFRVDNLPRTMPDDGTDFFIWSFKIDGGSDVVQRPNRNQVIGGAWKMAAEIVVWATTDALAKRIAGLVLDALPATGGDVDGLSRLYYTAFPTREWVVRGVLNEDRAGDERRFVQLTIPMECAFGNVGRAE